MVNRMTPGLELVAVAETKEKQAENLRRNDRRFGWDWFLWRNQRKSCQIDQQRNECIVVIASHVIARVLHLQEGDPTHDLVSVIVRHLEVAAPHQSHVLKPRRTVVEGGAPPPPLGDVPRVIVAFGHNKTQQ